MASKISHAVFAACLAVFVAVAAAHEGHEHTPGMVMAPEPSDSLSSFTYPSMVVGLLGLLVSSIAFRNKL